MGLSVGIVGLTNVGKTTIFNCFSNTKAEITSYGFSTNKSNIGMAKVPDPRLYELEKYQPTEKIIPTTVDFVDLPGLAKGASKGEGAGNAFLADLRNTDAIIHVLRCFDDENLPHVEVTIDPVRDIELIDFELQVKDLESIEKKITRMNKLVKVGDKEAKKALEVLAVFKEHLESMQPARTAPVKETDFQYIDDLFLLTMKPVIYVCNVADQHAVSGNEYVTQVKDALKDQEAQIFVLAAQLEAEIAELDSREEQLEFLADAGLSEPGVDRMIRAAYDMLDLQTFFTIGPQEIRAWTIKKGATAPEAAGEIHSDLQRGFIKAEVMAYDDFVSLRSEQACKEAGKLRLEGKNYVVKDGDIMHIRFNVSK